MSSQVSQQNSPEMQTGSQVTFQETLAQGGLTLETTMILLQLVLSDLEGDFAKLQMNSESYQMDLSRLLTKATETQSENKTKELEKQISKNGQNTGLQKTLKAFEVIGAVITSAVAILLGNPEVALALVTLTVLSETGAMNKLTSSIAKGLADCFEKAGMDPEVAQELGEVIASIAVTVLTVVATFGAGASAEAIRSSEAMTEDLTSRLGKGLEKTSKLALMTGTQALTGTNGIVDLFTLTAASSGNPQFKEAMEILGEIVQIVVAIAGMLAGGMGSALTESQNLVTESTDSISKMRQLTAKMTEKVSKLSKVQLQSLLMSARLAIPAFEAGPKIGMGVTDIELANIQNQLSDLNANLAEMQNSLTITQTNLKDSQKNASEMLSSYKNLITSIVQFIAPLNATNQVLATGI